MTDDWHMTDVLASVHTPDDWWVSDDVWPMIALAAWQADGARTTSTTLAWWPLADEWLLITDGCWLMTDGCWLVTDGWWLMTDGSLWSGHKCVTCRQECWCVSVNNGSKKHAHEVCCCCVWECERVRERVPHTVYRIKEKAGDCCGLLFFYFNMIILK